MQRDPSTETLRWQGRRGTRAWTVGPDRRGHCGIIAEGAFDLAQGQAAPLPRRRAGVGTEGQIVVATATPLV